MALVRALHGKRPWPNLSSMGGDHGGSSERKGGRGAWGRLLGGARGEGGLLGEGVPWGYRRSSVLHSLFYSVPEEEREGKEEGKVKDESLLSLQRHLVPLESTGTCPVS
jgi:hypothetical protein